MASNHLYINLNGEYISADQPSIMPGNRAFRYGDAVFETVRVMDGKPCYLNEHLERLRRAMQALKFEVKDGFSYKDLVSNIEGLIQKNGIDKGGKLRITVYRNDGGNYIPESSEKSFLIEAEPMVQNEFILNDNGITVDIFKDLKKRKTLFSPFKTGNAMLYVMAGLFARENDLDDALIVNNMDRIIEATSSNIFLYKNGSLYTPTLEDGCVDGIMRKQVMELASELNLNVFEGMLTMGNLLYADELFLTNSIRGICWVENFKEKVFTNEISARLTEQLNTRTRLKANSEPDLQGS